jgi:hypothetical protein
MDHLTAGLAGDPEPANVAHAYGLAWWMKTLYLTAAALMLLAAVFLIARPTAIGLEERIWHWIEAAALSLSGIYFAASAFCSCVLIDNYSVNVRGLFLTSSLPRHTIHWFALKKGQWVDCTILYPDAPETKKLIIANCFAFDEEWRQWIASLNQLPS